ncbi:MAG: NUDIX domain-containing protein [Bacilli bacterium]|nr:NUDIX domain-containing protein [Bacilli bacterium]
MDRKILTNFDVKSLIEYISCNIKRGYVDKKGNKHYQNEISLDILQHDYHLQTPDELISSECGWDFDVVELIRSYMRLINKYTESYYMEYNDGKNFHFKAFIIFKNNNQLWYELFDDSGLTEKENLLKNIYKNFQRNIKNSFEKVEPTAFYFDEYPKIDGNKGIFFQVKKKTNPNDYRYEVSSMSIVFCNNKVLTLLTTGGEYVIPKGHIESGETSLIAAIRECQEETGVIIREDEYIGECDDIMYSFNGANCRFLTNTEFYNIFKTEKVNKIVKVLVFRIAEERKTNITERNNFSEVFWMDIEELLQKNTYQNTSKVLEEAREIVNSYNKI